jgi:hypothetical protein
VGEGIHSETRVEVEDADDDKWKGSSGSKVVGVIGGVNGERDSEEVDDVTDEKLDVLGICRGRRVFKSTELPTGRLFHVRN